MLFELQIFFGLCFVNELINFFSLFLSVFKVFLFNSLLYSFVIEQITNECTHVINLLYLAVFSLSAELVNFFLVFIIQG